MITRAAIANPLLPTCHWESRCECCQLRRTDPEAFAWLTGALQGADGEFYTQAEIAAELSRRTGRTITQSQISTHKTKHHDRTLGDMVEAYAGHVAQLEVMAGMDSAEMAIGYAKLAMLKTAKLLDEELEAKDMASVANAVRGLATVLLGSDEAQANAQLAEFEARAAAARAAVAEGSYEEAAASWIETNYPEFAALAGDPDKLRRVLAQAGATAVDGAAVAASGATVPDQPSGTAPTPGGSV